MDDVFAPIVVFAFNRPESFKSLIHSLKKNEGAKRSTLYIFIDGPRPSNFDKDENEIKKIREWTENIEGFKEVFVFQSHKNKGLADSILQGVTDIIHRYGKIIVLEDDLIVNPNFLKYMNLNLNYYKNNESVFSICGYTNKVTFPTNYEFDSYFGPRSSSWGWATWKDRWDTVDWNLKDWNSVKKNKSGFNKWGGSDCYSMLKGWKEGKNNSWAIRFCYSQYIQNKVSIFPVKSLLINEGFNGKGTNCRKWSRFKYELMDSDKTDFKLPPTVLIYKSIINQALKYHDIPIRIISKLMYLLKK